MPRSSRFNIGAIARRMALLFSLSILLFNVACGGKSKPPPIAPVTGPAPIDEEFDDVKKAMEAFAAQLRGDKGGSPCDQLGVKVIASIGIQQQGGDPRFAGFGGGAGAAYGGGISGSPLTPPNSGQGFDQCMHIINQILWNATRIRYTDGRMWINDMQAKMWLAQNLAQYLDRIGNQVGPAFRGLGVQPEQILSKYKDGISSYVQGNIMPRLGQQYPGLSNEVNSYFNNFR